MKQPYAVMIPIFVNADTPENALEKAMEILDNSVWPFIVWDGYVTTNDYTIEDMENAGFTYVEV
jgi:hypothetical protein